MTDVTFFWLAFGAYLVGMCLLVMAALWRAGAKLAPVGRGCIWAGLAAQTVSIVSRAFAVGTAPMHMFFERMSVAFSAGPAWQGVVYVLVFVVLIATGVLGALFWTRRIVWLLAAGIALLVELILLDFLDYTRLPIEKVYEYLSFASWCSALLLLALSPKLRLVVLDAALALAACLLVVFAAIQPKSIELQLVPALQSYWLFIHVSLTSVAYAVFGMGFAIASLYLIKVHRPAAVGREARRRLMLTAAVAMGVAAVLVLVLVLSGVTLPFRSVAYTPRELAAAQPAQGALEGSDPQLPSPRVGQVARYALAVLGAYAAAAFVLFWLIYPLTRWRADASGLASYLFVVCALAILASCLLVGGLVRSQEHRITRQWERQAELRRLMSELVPHDGTALTGEALAADIEHWRGLSLQARGILARARWLPLTTEQQAGLADDPQFQALQDLYQKAGLEWKTPIRYKDIKEIGRELGKRAAVASSLAPELGLPADRAALHRLAQSFEKDLARLESGAILPRRAVGQLATFTGLSLLVAAPLGLALFCLLPRMCDRLPEAERLDRISYGVIVAAYPLFTFGALFAGAIWAHFAWGSWWGWDPKEVGSLVGWVLYTVYLHQRHREGLSARAAAVAGMLGFIACTLSLAGNAFLGGLHAYS